MTDYCTVYWHNGRQFRRGRKTFQRGDGEPAQLPGAHGLQQGAGSVERRIDAAGDGIGNSAGPGAPIGHVNELDASHALEQFTGEVRRGADPWGGISHLAWIGLGVVDEAADGSQR